MWVKVVRFAGGGEVGHQLEVYFVLLPKLTLRFYDAVIAVKLDTFEDNFVHWFSLYVNPSPVGGARCPAYPLFVVAQFIGRPLCAEKTVF